MAYAEGKTVQFVDFQGKWIVTDSPSFSSEYAWRIKPEPVTRPWKANEIPVGSVVIPKSSNGEQLLIVAAQRDVIFLGPDARGYNSDELLSKFTMLDGSPCGVTEEAKQ